MSLTMKRHYPLLLTFAGLLLILLVGLGSMQIVAYADRDQLDATPVNGTNYENSIALFDETAVHEIQIIAPADTQQRMIRTYQQTEAKDYFGVDVIIDGVRIDNVGIRLKGNASLMSVANADDFFGGLAFFPPELREVPQHCWAFSPIPPPPGLVESDVDETSKPPYLIKFDAFVPGQTYQGQSEIAVRTSGVAVDAAQMQEPLTNYALNQAGIPASETAYISLRFNDDAPQLYTIAEVLDQAYIDKHFPDSSGVLYKVVEVGNDFTYLGDDLTLYVNIFEQKTAVNQADLTPLTQFMKFVTESDDETFARELENRLDLDAFATYLAVENLLVNFDSLAGMGNNYYLYYSENSRQFTILAWDANESLGKLGAATFDLYWTDRFAGPGVGPPQPADDIVLDANMPTECIEAFEKLANLGPPPGGGPPPGVGAQAGEPPLADGSGPFGDGRHILKDRFLANADFRTLYDSKLQTVYEQVFVNELLLPQIETYTMLLTSYNIENALFDQNEFDLAIQNMENFIRDRQEYLQSTDLLGAIR
ncbi:hypothetical protein MNBD_CHLOROFLEXI01-1071 [hydrothermal vent metagenome]|uniref:Cellulosomal protein n=1 Tax=hydrothermal vent metagenome TaxID=652676 RepID=A0A3B0VL46_9ZZZZ